MIEKICKNCSERFDVSNEDIELFEQIAPTFDGKKFKIPPPTLCPPCRQQRRLAFRNERSLYNNKSALSGKEIIAMFDPETEYKVYDQDEWWSDKWNPLDYGQDYDPNKKFSEQLKELTRKVPHVSLVNTNVENSYYTNFALNHKNCYLIFGGSNNEDCMYGKFVVSCKDCLDILSCHNCELCYQSVKSERCYDCRYITSCKSCNACTMCEDCTGCSNCIACFNLKQKSYYFMNENVGKEKYEELKKQYSPLTVEKAEILRGKLRELSKNLPHINAHIYNSEDSTGEQISNCKNCINSFSSFECENSKYLYFCPKTYHSQDCTFNAPKGPEFSYNLCSTVDLKNSMANFLFWYGTNAFYSIGCHYCNNVFGCVSLRHQEYCILNKKYSKEEYEKLAALIVEKMQETGEWGEYLQPEVSMHCYNETIAQEHFPLTKEEAIRLGFKWKDEKKEKKAFRLDQKELDFYKKMDLGTPDSHPDQRHLDRIKLYRPLRLWSHKCDKCGQEIKTSFPPERTEKIYCEDCYLKDTY